MALLEGREHLAHAGLVTVERVWAAHDCGRALNPTLVEGQIEGSVYMGYAEAIMEAQVYRPDGLHVGPNLLDYRIPTSVETPELLARIVETLDPGGPYGAKEAGEGPLHPIIPAIANAIWDAVGVRLRRIPFTPERVLDALARAQAQRAGVESEPPMLRMPEFRYHRARSAEEITARRSTMVIPEETEITTWGFTQWCRLCTLRMK